MSSGTEFAQASAHTIGVDVGGTKIAAGLVTADGEILQRLRADTAQEPQEIAAQISELVADLQGGAVDVQAVGIGAAGFISSDRSTIMFAPNIDWSGFDLGRWVSELVQLPVVVENDANAAAWGEYRFGAGKGFEDVLLVTLGTGVGGGIIEQGRLVRGAHGAGAEIGHLRVVPDGLLCGCGQRGCLEQYASGRALIRMAREALDRDRASDAKTARLRAIAEDVDGLTGPEITAIARGGDALAQSLVTDLAELAGSAIASLGAIVDPGVIVIGGGLGEASDLLLTALADSYRSHLPGLDRPVAAIRAASLGNSAGLIGAADLVRAQFVSRHD